MFICLQVVSDSPCDFSVDPLLILEYAVYEFPKFHLLLFSNIFLL